jgi:phage gp36-like protein
MIYLTTADILTVIHQEELDELTIDTGVDLDLIEANAMGEMGGYLNIRYDLDKCFDANPKIPIITKTLVDIVLYDAHAAVMPDNIPTLRETRYKNAIGWLEKTADGFIAPMLPAKDTDPTTPLRYGNSATKENRYY